MHPPFSLSLAPELQQRLATAAEAQGASVSALCQQWIIEGLERLETSQELLPESSARCSVRTGLYGPGPTPLPLQQ